MVMFGVLLVYILYAMGIVALSGAIVLVLYVMAGMSSSKGDILTTIILCLMMIIAVVVLAFSLGT